MRGKSSTYGLVSRLMSGWVDQWVEPCKINKNLINLELINIIQFSLNIYGDIATYGWVYGCFGG